MKSITVIQKLTKSIFDVFHKEPMDLNCINIPCRATKMMEARTQTGK